jgi:hypothetical protein
MPKADSLADADERIRGYWYEWSVCEGERGTATEHALADAWLGGLSLSDHLNPAPITDERGKLSCAGLGVAFGKLAQLDPDCPFAKARRAAAYLGRLTKPDPKSAGYFDRYDREADKLKTPYPHNITEAIVWMAAGVAQAGGELQDPFLRSLADPKRVSFKLLREFLNANPHRRAQTTPPARDRRPRVVSPSDKALEIHSSLDAKVQAGIERVIAEAWKAVPTDTVPETRFKVARQQAMQSISRLSPYIKKQVGAHFQTNNWEILKSRDPDAQQQRER